MTDSVRWLALLPDPVTGLDQPIAKDSNGHPLTWLATDRVEAIALAKADLSPAQYRLASIVSVVDWESRQQSQQRAKLTSDGAPRFGVKNPRQTCWRCGAQTPTRDSLYCHVHRPRGGRRKAAG